MSSQRHLVWNGELTTRMRLIRRGMYLAAPGMLWILLFLALPSLLLIVVSMTTRGDYGQIEWVFSLDNFTRLLGFSSYGWSADYLWILFRSVWVAFWTTLICVLLAYPLCFHIANRAPEKRYFWLTLIIIPFWTNLVIRAYAWLLVLAPQLPFAKFAAVLGIIPDGSPLYPSALAVYLGMVATFLPFVAMPLYANVEKLDWALVEAAKDLYAGRARIFWHAIWPQTVPGLSVGITLTFIPAMGMFVVPDLLGGAKYMLVGNLIQQQFGTSRDWPFGAAVSLALMVLTLVGLHVQRKHSGEGGAA
ncbi:ABC transporter permease [Nitratidesulfovibrio termitidis]|uniref:ABC transporter permease n=1 Tax=Nitratidesulfovibrio termitidis TaxID=42252 RepID=UPI000553CD86|nr:ABC transporter permease [Nitratidesulfovibrio termitidis]